MSVAEAQTQETNAALDSKNVSKDWVTHHIASYIKNLNLFVIGAMVVCAIFDPLFFNGPELYTPYRFIPIGFSFLALIAYDYQRKKYRLNILGLSTLLVGSTTVVNFLYHYYLAQSPGADRFTVVFGNLLVSVLSVIVVHRFAMAQALMFLPALTSSIIHQLLFPELKNDFLLVSISLVIAYFLSWFLRKEFKKSLSIQFRNLNNMIPKREAYLITVLDSQKAWNKVFRPELRNSVCLCADWRGYQRIAKQVKPEVLSKYFEVFYEPAIALLEKIDPEGTYYANWVADEFFVIFYDKDDDAEAIKTRALQFAKAFASTFYVHMKPLFDFDLRYDIGLSFGRGLLGMQGPRGLKRTTISAEHAGTAKRLQTEAKELRLTSSEASDFPIMIMDQELGEFAVESELFQSTEVRFTTLNHSDLNPDMTYFVYRHLDKPEENSAESSSANATNLDRRPLSN